MGKKREKTQARKMQPLFLVFCEGETEKVYVDSLRLTYRKPIKIISLKEGDKITPHLMEQRVKETKISPSDQSRIFLMYDLDVPAIHNRLQQCSAKLNCLELYSNPCIELWFLLHHRQQAGYLASKSCINELKKSKDIWKDYKKAELTKKQKDFLWENRCEAIKRAKKLPKNNNPSSSIYLFLEELEKS